MNEPTLHRHGHEQQQRHVQDHVLCFDGSFKRRIVDLVLRALINVLAHCGTVCLLHPSLPISKHSMDNNTDLVVLDIVLGIGNDALGLDASHNRLHKHVAEVRVFAAYVLKVTSVAGNTSDTDTRAKLDVGTLQSEQVSTLSHREESPAPCRKTLLPWLCHTQAWHPHPRRKQQSSWKEKTCLCHSTASVAGSPEVLTSRDCQHQA